MTPASKSNDTQRRSATCIPFGLVFGTALGAYLSDTLLGIALGLLAGGTAMALNEYRHGRQSIVWPIVGGFAFIWIIALFVTERT